MSKDTDLVINKENILGIIYDLKENKIYIQVDWNNLIEIDLKNPKNVKFLKGDNAHKKRDSLIENNIFVELDGLDGITIRDYLDKETVITTIIGIDEKSYINRIKINDVIEKDSLTINTESIINLKNKIDKIIKSRFGSIGSYLNKIFLKLKKRDIGNIILPEFSTSIQIDNKIDKRIFFNFIKEIIKELSIKFIELRKDFKPIFNISTDFNIYKESDNKFKFSEKVKKFIPEEKGFINLLMSGFEVEVSENGKIKSVKLPSGVKYKNKIGMGLKDQIMSMLLSIFKNESQNLLHTILQIERFNRTNNLKDFILVFKHELKKEIKNNYEYIDKILNDFLDLSSVQLRIGKSNKNIKIDLSEIIDSIIIKPIFDKC